MYDRYMRFDTTFELKMRPVPKERPRAARTRDGRIFMYTPKRTAGAEKQIALLSRQYAPTTTLTGPVAVELSFRYAIPKTRKELVPGDFVNQKPDLDNLVKTVLDALNKDGIWWKDDSQVVVVRSEKVYAYFNSIRIRFVELRR